MNNDSQHSSESSFDALMSQAKEAEARSDFATARGFLRQASDAQPSNAYVWFKLGVAEYELRHFDSAEGYLRRALVLDPRLLVPVCGSLAHCYRDQGKLAEAEVAYQQIPQDAYTASSLVLRAANLDSLGDIMEAEKLLLRALNLEPNNDEALTNLAIIYQSTRPQEALELLERAISSDPQNAVAQREFGFMLSKLGKTEQANEHLKRSLEIDSDNWWTLLYLGANDRCRGAFDESEQHFQHAHQLRPNEALPLTLLGDLYRQQDRLTDAEQSYLTALRSKDLTPNPHLKLARLYKVQGRITEALDQVDKALSMQPNDQKVMDLKTEIELEKAD